MSDLDPGQQSPAPARHFWAYMRPVLGIGLLGILVLWSLKSGRLLDRSSIPAVAAATLVGAGLVLVNSMTLVAIARVFNGALTPREALRVSALGSLGNALGGLPVGTALKYAILYRGGTLSISQLTTGLALFSIGISLGLMTIASVAAWGTVLDPRFKYLTAIALGAAVLALAGIATFLWNRAWFGRLIHPFVTAAGLRALCGLSALTSLLFVFDYWVIAKSLPIDMLTTDVLFISSVGILFGLGSLLQSVGGIQELSIGLAALGTGYAALHGIELALIVRFSFVLASSILLVLGWAFPRAKSDSGRAQRPRD